MEELKKLTKDEKLALAMKVVGHFELAGTSSTDGYDVLMMVAHLLFPGHAIKLTVGDFRLLGVI
jgi:hypothetical protein